MTRLVDGPVFDQPFPPSDLREGARVRVRLKNEKPLIEGLIRSVDEKVLRIDVPRPSSVLPLLPFLGSRNAFVQDESPEETAGPIVRRLVWQQIDRVWVRGRAMIAGLAWGGVLFLAFGSCGDALDHFTDGFVEHQLVYFGRAIGILVGALVMRFGREWRTVPITLPEA